MGSLIDPFSALTFGTAVIIALALLVTGKLVGGFLVGHILSLQKNSPRIKPWAFGVWLVPRGEFSFVKGQFALTTGIIGKDIFSLVGLSVLVTALAGPFIQKFVEPGLATSSHLFKPKTDQVL